LDRHTSHFEMADAAKRATAARLACGWRWPTGSKSSLTRAVCRPMRYGESPKQPQQRSD
jgi:hypothetical protein